MAAWRPRGLHNPDPNGGEEARGGAIRGFLARSRPDESRNGTAWPRPAPLSHTQGQCGRLPGACPSRGCRSVPVPPSSPACPGSGWLSAADPRACEAPHDLHGFYPSFCPSPGQHRNCPSRQHAYSLRDRRSAEQNLLEPFLPEAQG